MDHWVETFEVEFPAALTIRPEAARPRDIPLAGLAQAFDRREVEVLTAADLGLTAEQVGEAGSPTRVLSIKPITHERRCRFLEGETVEMAEKLMDHLTAEGLVD
jgi:electron transfer flavoprotein beta subunit